MSDWHFQGDAIRHKHAEMRERLAEVEALVAPLGAGVTDMASAHRVLRFFKSELDPHMDDEERGLYPEVDRLVGGNERFTSALRREHRIMRRWVVHLEAASQRGDDLRPFARCAENLVGMLYAHMETEEAVILPLVDFGHLGNGVTPAEGRIGQHTPRQGVSGVSRKAWWRRTTCRRTD